MPMRSRVDLHRLLIVACLAFLAQRPVGAAAPQDEPSPIMPKPTTTPAPDKSGYTLFNPAPRQFMRSFNSDRPSVTEGPYTVDAGHLQAEFSFLEYTYDYDHGVRTDAFAVLPANLRIGVLNNLEADVIFDPYQYERFHSQRSSRRLSGFGDIALRAKLNLWGNDNSENAGGLIPFVTLPTASEGLSNHHIEAGLILPFAMELPAGFALGTMAEFDASRNEANTAYGVDFVHSVTLGHDLVRGITAYVEYVGVSPIRTGRTYLASFDTGVTFAVSSDVQLDTGINIGLSGRANDFTVFAGLSFRI